MRNYYDSEFIDLTDASGRVVPVRTSDVQGLEPMDFEGRCEAPPGGPQTVVKLRGCALEVEETTAVVRAMLREHYATNEAADMQAREDRRDRGTDRQLELFATLAKKFAPMIERFVSPPPPHIVPPIGLGEPVEPPGTEALEKMRFDRMWEGAILDLVTQGFNVDDAKGRANQLVAALKERPKKA